MNQNQYVALLRGINVGGKNLIKMAALKVCFEAQGFSNVATYIQSGNVLFSTKELNATKLIQKIESSLSRTFNYNSQAVVLSDKHLAAVIQQAPKGFGKEPTKYRYNVLFIKTPLTVAEAIKNIPIKEGVDQVFTGPEALYHIRLERKATQSRLNRIVAMPMYQNMTIRNWNTTTKLLKLMEQAAQ